MPYECVKCQMQYDTVEGPCLKCGGSRYFNIPVPTILQSIEALLYFSIVGWFTSRVLVFHIRRIASNVDVRFDLGAHRWADLWFFLLCVPFYFAGCFAIVWFVKGFERRFPSIARKERGELVVVLVLGSVLTMAVAVTFELLYTVFHS